MLQFSSTTNVFLIRAQLEIMRLDIVERLRLLVHSTNEELIRRADFDARSPKTGKKWPSLPNQSSAVGEVPAKQSGTLLASIKSQFSPSGLVVETGPTVDYAKYLHKDWPGEGSRPILERALNYIEPGFYTGVRAIIASAGAEL